jgi:hypothetical protein
MWVREWELGLCVHGCLKTGTVYNEHTAWSHHTQTAA